MPDVIRSRLIVRRPPFVRRLSVSVPGGGAVRFDRLDSSELFKPLLWRGFSGYEPETSTALVLSARHARTILDVGSYLGYCSLIMARANDRSRVYAFEAMTENAVLIGHYSKLNALENIEVIECAVGDQDGEATFYVPTRSNSKHPGIASLVDRFAAGKTFADRGRVKRVVKTVTLDTFCAREGIEDVDLIKIDVEEAEDMVIAGAQDIIARCRPDIVLEVIGDGMCDLNKIEGVLSPHGYQYYSLKDGTVEPCARLEDAGLRKTNARGSFGEAFATTRPDRARQLAIDVRAVLF